MDAELLEQLLHESESTALDFKRDQYPFAGASDEAKAEILKDIIGFANAWRRSTAYILIGVEDVKGGRGIIHGISDHLDDHSLQQFVNSLTNRPVHFSYRAVALDGKQVGVIQIEEQERPVFLNRDYGKLKRNAVYVRRGSSTDPTRPANPDEIARMGNSHVGGAATLAVELADDDSDSPLGYSVKRVTTFIKMPDGKSLPDYAGDPIGGLYPSVGTAELRLRSLRDFSFVDSYNKDYWRELSKYCFAKKVATSFRLMIHNSGSAAAKSVRIELICQNPSLLGIYYPSIIPDCPKKKISHSPVGFRHSAVTAIRSAINQPKGLSIEGTGDKYAITDEYDNIQPGRRLFTDSFVVACKYGNTTLDLIGSVYADNISTPTPVALQIEMNVTGTEYGLQELAEYGKRTTEL